MVVLSATLPEMSGPSVSAMRVLAAAPGALSASRTTTIPANPGQWRVRSIAPGSWQMPRAVSREASRRQVDAARLVLRAAVIGHEGRHQGGRAERGGAQGPASGKGQPQAHDPG